MGWESEEERTFREFREELPKFREELKAKLVSALTAHFAKNFTNIETRLRALERRENLTLDDLAKVTHDAVQDIFTPRLNALDARVTEIELRLGMQKPDAPKAPPASPN